MRRVVILVVVGLFAMGMAPQAIAITKWKRCNVEATEKNLKAEKRKAFMRKCLATKKSRDPRADEANQPKKD